MSTPPRNAITAKIILGRRDVVLGDDDDGTLSFKLLLPLPTIPLPRLIGGVGDDDFFCLAFAAMVDYLAS